MMAEPQMNDRVILVANADLGHAEPAPGQRVLGNYLRALAEMDMRSHAICL
jgi:hypothetical protein